MRSWFLFVMAILLLPMATLNTADATSVEAINVQTQSADVDLAVDNPEPNMMTGLEVQDATYLYVNEVPLVELPTGDWLTNGMPKQVVIVTIACVNLPVAAYAFASLPRPLTYHENDPLIAD